MKALYVSLHPLSKLKLSTINIAVFYCLIYAVFVLTD